jgi:hypothetical protein
VVLPVLDILVLCLKSISENRQRKSLKPENIISQMHRVTECFMYHKVVKVLGS